ncbi:MAG: phage head-tail connector protein [Methylocystis sp.]
MTTGDLVALDAVKNWLGVVTGDDDALLGSLISQISRGIYNYINRSFVLPVNVVEAYDGAGRDTLLLRNWPVGAIASLVIDGEPIPPAPTMAAGVHSTRGYVLEQSDDAPPGGMQCLFLRGPHVFRKGRQNVLVSYRAGYEIVGETQTIPLSAPFAISAFAPYGGWAVDTGVAYVGGAALVAVLGAPTQGQYSVSNGTYTFAAADAGSAVALSYGYIPADLAQCALEWVADRYKYKDRIGMTSKSLGGQETVAYQNTATPDFVARSLMNFRRIIAN